MSSKNFQDHVKKQLKEISRDLGPNPAIFCTWCPPAKVSICKVASFHWYIKKSFTNLRMTKFLRHWKQIVYMDIKVSLTACGKAPEVDLISWFNEMTCYLTTNNLIEKANTGPTGYKLCIFFFLNLRLINRYLNVLTAHIMKLCMIWLCFYLHMI